MSNFLKKLAFTSLLAAVLTPMVVSADTKSEIKALIMDTNAEVRESLTAASDGLSKNGTLEFWSSGGLMQHVPADSPATTYEKFSITPKHIKVITLVEDQAAVAMFYSEGSFHESGQKAVSHYMTRATVVYVKEDGEWKEAAAHWSPIAAGSGTQATAVD